MASPPSIAAPSIKWHSLPPSSGVWMPQPQENTVYTRMTHQQDQRASYPTPRSSPIPQPQMDPLLQEYYWDLMVPYRLAALSEEKLSILVHKYDVGVVNGRTGLKRRVAIDLRHYTLIQNVSKLASEKYRDRMMKFMMLKYAQEQQTRADPLTPPHDTPAETSLIQDASPVYFHAPYYHHPTTTTCSQHQVPFPQHPVYASC